MDQNKSKQQQDHEYEFLDLSDVDDNERTRLSSALLQQQQRQQQKSQQEDDKHVSTVSLINDDAADANCYQSITTTDDECQIVLNDNNIQSNLNCTSWPSNAPYVTKNSVETKHFSRLVNRKSLKDNNQFNKQMPKMSPPTNSQQSPTQSGNHQQSNQTQQPQPQQQQQHQPPPPSQQQNHQNTNNIPSHSIQSHVYQQSQMQPQQQTIGLPQNYIPHGGSVSAGGNLYHVLPHMPSLYFSNFTANVNVHGYQQSMQSPYLAGNAQQYIPSDGQPNAEQSHHLQSQPPVYVRGARRGRGRGYNGGHRRDFQSRQINSVQDMNQQQTSTHIMETQQTIPNSSNFGQSYYVNPYMGLYPNQFALGHHPSSGAAQHASGAPFYVAGAMPGYGYAYHPNGMIYPMMSMDYVMDEKTEDGLSTENGNALLPQQWQMDYPSTHIDPALQQQQTEEYLSQQQQHPSSSDEFSAQQQQQPLQEPPTEDFIAQQPNEFIPVEQQQQQHQLQPSNEYLQSHQTDISGGFIPRPDFVYSAQPANRHSPHMTSPVFKQQDDGTFQTFPAEFIPAAHQQQNIRHHHQIEATLTEIPAEVDPNIDYLPHEQSNIDTFNNNNNVDFKAKEFEEPTTDHQNFIGETGFAYNTPTEIQLKASGNSNEKPVPNNKHFVNTSLSHSSSSNEKKSDIIESTKIAASELLTQKSQSINGLVEMTTEKLVIKSERSAASSNSKNQITPTVTTKKSTQSVAVSVVPSNNYPATEFSIAKAHGPNSSGNNKLVLNSNNGVSNNSNHNHVNNNKPIVPKADEQPLNVATTTQTAEKIHAIDTFSSQSSEMQTIPVSEMQTEPIVLVSSKASSTTSPQPIVTVQPSTNTWASLFNNSSAGSIPTKRPIETNNKPVAKVLPYNSTSNEPHLRQPTPVTPTPIANTAGTLSYSAASSQKLPTPVSSAQAISNAAKKPPPMKARVAPSSKVLHTTDANQTDESSYRLGDFLLKYKVDNTAISLRPRGLTNRSNYCYINAILQALVACPPFYNLMKSMPLDQPGLRFKTNTPTIDAVVELVREFSNLPNGSRLQRRDKGGNKKEDLIYELVCDPSIEPTAIHKLWNSTRSDSEGRQEDAEEFLGYVLNKLNDEMLELKKLVEKPPVVQNEVVPNGIDVNSEVADDEGAEWQLIGNRNKGSITRSTDFGRTPLSDIFRGELRSRLQREGDHSTDVLQPFFTLQLNIEKANSVKEALENFVNKDQLEGVTCTKTNQEVNAWQQMTLEKLPVVLILHLKLFDYKGDVCTKILKAVDFPIELKLDSKILSSKKYNTKQKQYRLFAVVYHDGKEATKGHYITDVFHTGYLNWIRYDDSTVKRVTEKNVLHPHAPRVPYLLYYRRSDTLQNPTNTNSNSK